MSYMYRQLQHRYVSCGHFDDRHHSQKDGTTHIIHCTLIILTIIQSGQGLFCCSTLVAVWSYGNLRKTLSYGITINPQVDAYSLVLQI